MGFRLQGCMERPFIRRGDCARCHQRRRRGSTLLLAIIFTTVLTVVAGGIIGRVMHERTAAQLGLEQASLLYLAEGYVEKAMWAINNGDWSGDWESFNNDEDRYMPFTKVMLGKREAYVHTLVISANDNPTIYSEARTVAGNGRPLNRQIRIEYNARNEIIDDDGSGIPGGLIFQGLIDLSGQPTIDSYDSRLGNPDPILNRGDDVTLATVSTATDAFKVSGQVNIYGYAGTGLEEPIVDISGPHNKLHGDDTPAGTNWDWKRLYGDFNFDFPPVAEPDWSGAIATIPEPNGHTITIGTPGGPVTRYDGKEIKLSGNADTVLQVAGPVQMRLSDGMSTTGQAHIEIIDGGSLEIYTVKDVSISGQAIINRTSNPENMKLFGTVNTARDQTFSLSGEGFIAMVVYAPNAILNISGQGALAGSFVGYEMQQSGQGSIHYDVALGGGDSNQGEETAITIGGVTDWHDTSGILFNFDIEDYVKENGGTYNVAI